MALHLLLLLFLSPTGQGWDDSLPEVLQAPVGGTIQVQCHYQLQDSRARKLWCKFLSDGCQPLGSSAVDRQAPGASRVFLTDLGGGQLQVQMVMLRMEDSGEYGCVVEGPAGPQTVHRVALDVSPTVTDMKNEEETYRLDSLADGSSSKSGDSTSYVDPHQDDKSIIPLIWGIVLLVGLLVVTAALFAVVAKKRGSGLGVCGRFQSTGISNKASPLDLHPTGDSALARDVSSDVPYVRLDSPPSFENITYSNLPLGPLSENSPSPISSSFDPLPPKATSSQPVTYATVIFPGVARDGGAPCELAAQDPANSQGPSS
ncbi:trem-like transcript 1 protein [Suncus etruscus]|uniref:trem-like transcript 1 protein n=1 Tax=Suncus etruscus TaxID=109475 RepID=UPI00211046CD|nr:trem-like transcript 1 protein [Suncus etruscus]